MKNIKYLALAITVSLFATSCNDDMDTLRLNNPVEVETEKNVYEELGIELLDDASIIRFKDESAYTDLLNVLAAKTEQEKRDFFEKVPLKSQYILLNEADEELRTLSEADEEQSFKSKNIPRIAKSMMVFLCLMK
jgi:hypothetical protein